MLAIPDSAEEVTPEWLTGVLRQALAIHAEVAAVEITPFGAGVGILSSMLRCALTYVGEARGPASLIVKLEPDRPSYRQAAQEDRAFEREVRFYREIAPQVPVRVPKFYHGEVDAHRGVLVLEDLGHMKARSQVFGLHDHETMAAVKQLARLHAHYWDHSDLAQIGWMPVHDPRLTRHFESHWAPFEEVYGLRIGPNAVALGRRLLGRLEWLYGQMEQRPMTICHGDFRGDNLLFQPDPIESPGDQEVAIVDWQLATRSFAALDVSRLMGGSEPAAERRQHPMEVVGSWHDALLQEGVENYDLETAKADFRLGALVQLCYPVRIFSHWGPEPPGRQGQLLDSVVSRVYAQALEVDVGSLLPD